MRGQTVSVDAVISLSLLAAILAVWNYMYQDYSPVYQAYTYRETYVAANHIVNELLFDQSLSNRCKTPQGVPVLGCVTSLPSASDLGADKLDMNVYIHCSSGASVGSPPGSSALSPRVVRSVQLCIGSWNACTWTDCNVEVWHK
jgi:hypothetical protein